MLILRIFLHHGIWASLMMSFSILVFDVWVASNTNSKRRTAFLVGSLGFVMFLPRSCVGWVAF